MRIWYFPIRRVTSKHKKYDVTLRGKKCMMRWKMSNTNDILPFETEIMRNRHGIFKRPRKVY